MNNFKKYFSRKVVASRVVSEGIKVVPENEFSPITKENLTQIVEKEGCGLEVNWGARIWGKSTYNGKDVLKFTFPAWFTIVLFWETNENTGVASPAQQPQTQDNIGQQS